MTMAWTPDDRRWMRQALALAARGQTPPNPMVGCVLVRDGAVVGRGYHRRAGEPHAEAMALASAGEAARGATAYVSLEPCSHTGRTPPCADALVRAGVARVVAAVSDPNPKVAGNGLERLRRAGIAVECGLLEERARELNRAFFHFHVTGRPLVTLKAAVSLDGKTATRTGDSRWITGEAARRWAHRERARSGAILCGVGTVVADDPSLTARFTGVLRQPLRVVLDPRLRIPEGSQLVRTAREVPTLVVAGERDTAGEKSEYLQRMGVQILRLPADNDHALPLTLLLSWLAEREIISVLVEGGAATHAAFLECGAVDRLWWFVAPVIIGGRDAPTSVSGTGADRMARALNLADFRVRRLGRDLLVESKPLWSDRGR